MARMLAALEELADETRRVRQMLERRGAVPRWRGGDLIELARDFLARVPQRR